VRKRRSEGWFTEIERKSGKTVVLYRWIEGDRERKYTLGSVEEFPSEKSRWKEVFRLGFDRQIEMRGPRSMRELIEHWLEKECPGDDSDPRDRRASRHVTTTVATCANGFFRNGARNYSRT
jgi:hypothetical protein